MRHVTWAAAWFLVGLAVVLGTASVLEHRAVVAERAIQPVSYTHLVAYRRSAYATQHD